MLKVVLNKSSFMFVFIMISVVSNAFFMSIFKSLQDFKQRQNLPAYWFISKVYIYIFCNVWGLSCVLDFLYLCKRWAHVPHFSRSSLKECKLRAFMFTHILRALMWKAPHAYKNGLNSAVNLIKLVYPISKKKRVEVFLRW